MNAAGIPDFRAGDVLRAADLTRLAKLCAGDIAVQEPLFVASNRNGILTIGVRLPQWIWAKVTAFDSATNRYSWTQQVPHPSGTWSAGVLTGSPSADGAYEWNGNTSVPVGAIVRLIRARETAEWLFQFGSCQQGTKIPGIPPPVLQDAMFQPLPPPTLLQMYLSTLQTTVGSIQHSHSFGP
jgi:hypothetical protein